MFTQSNRFRRFLAVTTAIGMLAPAASQLTPAFAQDAPPPPGADSADSTAAPPTRVGEIGGITGSVSFNGSGSNGQWVAASANYPLTTGDSVFTQAGAQAALAIDSSRLTLTENTELQVTSIDQNTVAATQSQGEMFLSINYLQPGQNFVLTTPRGTVTISQNGNYSINAGDQNSPTVITVLAGAATVTDPGATLQVQAGQAGVLSGTDQTTAQLGAAEHDAFITQMLAQIAPPPPSYAPPVVQQMTGVSELGNYGSWNQNAQYGAVWYPQVASGWTPYREGHWAYVAPWGYTWVENEPWGFAPFHYGRWIDDGNRWGWCPAPAYGGGGYGGGYQPVYAPAVVSFFGGIGAGIGIGITIGALNSGNIGWVPLAPDEPYYPYYRSSPDYIRNINRVNVRNFNNIDVRNTNIHNTTINNHTTVINNYNYAGLKNRRAATYIPANAMSRGEQVGRYGKPATDKMLADARPLDGQGFRPQASQGGAQHNGPLALPAPNFQHRVAAAPQLTSFAQRRKLPQAVISHEPAQRGPNGAGFVHPNPGQPLPPNGAKPRAGFAAHPGALPGQHALQPNPGFATMPGYHAPPPPPGGAQHALQPGGGQAIHPGAGARPGLNALHPATPQKPGFATAPGFHQPPAPPGGHHLVQPHVPQPLGGQANHPAPMPRVITPHEPAPAPAFHPPAQPQNHQPAPQFHPQPKPQYHPPVQAFHPQPQYHPPVGQQAHPQPTQQFHPQPQQFHPQQDQHPGKPQ